MKTDELAPPAEDIAGSIEDAAAIVENVAAPADESPNTQDDLQWEATRLSEFKKEKIKRGNQTPCPACAMYVHVNANKCPHCSSDIAANNALVRESLRRLNEVTISLEAMREEHIERFRDAPRPPFADRFKSFFTDPQTRQEMKIVAPSLIVVFGGMALCRMMGNPLLFWACSLIGSALVYVLFHKLSVKRFVTIDLYRTVLVFGVLAIMASAAQPTSWWSSTGGDRVEVLGSAVNIRELQTTQSPVIATATRGEKLKVIERRNNWYRVETRDGQEGWVYSSLVQ